MEKMQVIRALLSVSDKTGLVDFAKKLNQSGVELVATGGTAVALEDAGLPVVQVSDFTQSPEVFGGRVKTLHPKIFGGILFKRDNPDHIVEAKKENIPPIDLVVCNLYPFTEKVKPGETPIEEAVELIDIGGHTLIRASSKNLANVLILTDPSDYDETAQTIEKNEVSQNLRSRLAVKALAHAAEYDMVIAERMSQILNPEDTPEFTGIALKKVSGLRYGENPHQPAAWYKQVPSGKNPGLADAKVLGGKELSYNNLLDLEAAVQMVRDFAEPTAAVLKHNNPCGLASNGTISVAYKNALDCDPLSAFGCVIGLNRPVDMETAQAIHETGFVEALIAPGYEEGTLGLLLSKKQRRILELPGMEIPAEDNEWLLRAITGGALLQKVDRLPSSEYTMEVVTEVKPTPEQMQSLLFAFQACKQVKSNAIVLVKGRATVGIGAGQMSRVDSSEIAVKKAGDKAKGSILGSDAFFPFADGVEAAAAAGVSAIIQPGGSKRDNEVIEACNRLKIPMVFTGFRHFRH